MSRSAPRALAEQVRSALETLQTAASCMGRTPLLLELLELRERVALVRVTGPCSTCPYQEGSEAGFVDYLLTVVPGLEGVRVQFESTPQFGP
ncbi:MAG: hypothetical protein L0216_16190 [Planctomycetales bacterium]|nr:hypothetical protein [Planctomycetales bacterium]